MRQTSIDGILSLNTSVLSVNQSNFQRVFYIPIARLHPRSMLLNIVRRLLNQPKN